MQQMRRVWFVVACIVAIIGPLTHADAEPEPVPEPESAPNVAGAEAPSTFRMIKPEWLHVQWTDYDPETDTLIGAVAPFLMFTTLFLEEGGTVEEVSDFYDDYYGPNPWSYTVAYRKGEIAWSRLIRMNMHTSTFACNDKLVHCVDKGRAFILDGATGEVRSAFTPDDIMLSPAYCVDCPNRQSIYWVRDFNDSNMKLVFLEIDSGESRRATTASHWPNTRLFRQGNEWVCGGFEDETRDYVIFRLEMERGRVLRIDDAPFEVAEPDPAIDPETNLIGVYGDNGVVMSHGNSAYSSTDVMYLAKAWQFQRDPILIGDNMYIAEYVYDKDGKLIYIRNRINVRTGAAVGVDGHPACDEFVQFVPLSSGDGYFYACHDGRVFVVLNNDEVREITPPSAIDLAKAGDVPFPVE